MPDHATLLACYRSGQIPEAAWQEHLKDEGLRAYVEGQRAVVRLDPKALMPCPFCGDRPELHQAEERKSAAVMCGCTAMVMGSFGEDAVATWNRRAPAGTAAVPADVAGLVAELTNEVYRHELQHIRSSSEIDRLFQQSAAALVSMSAELAAVKAENARLYDSYASMANGEVRMTAAEDVLAWLLVEKIGVPDDQSYTPDMAQQILSAAIEGRNAAEAALAEMQPHIDKIERCIRINNEMGRVVMGQTEAAQALADIARRAHKGGEDNG